MKEETITIRVSEKTKKDFQEICNDEECKMSDKLHNYIINEIKVNNNNYKNNIEYIFNLFGYNNVFILENFQLYTYNNIVVDYYEPDDENSKSFNTSTQRFNETIKFIDFLNKNKDKKVYLYLMGSSLPNEIRYVILDK